MERFLLKFGGVLILTGLIVVTVAVPERPLGPLGFASGSLLSVGIFLSTAFLYGCIGRQAGRGRTGLAAGLLALTFLLMAAILWMANRVHPVLFWCLVGGILVMPATVLLYIILESVGITHTNYFV